MRKEKEKSYREMTCRHVFSVVIVVALILSAGVGIVAVENGNRSINAEAAQNVNSAVTDIQESFIGNLSFEIKVPQSKEKLRVPERRRVSTPPDGGQDIPFPIVSQNKKGLRVFSYIQNATRSGIGVINASQSNESPDISILKTAQKEASTENHNKDKDITNCKIAEELKPKQDYKAQKVVNSELTHVMPASSIEESSSQLTITIIDETTASGEWSIYYSSKYAGYLSFAYELFKNNIESVEKGMEDLFLQDVQDIKITRGDETLVVTFNLKGNFTNSFVTGKFRYTYELNEYAPTSVSILKVVIPQNKTLVSINPGPNEIEANELTYHNYNWIYPLEIHYTEKTLLAEGISPPIGKEWELPKLTSSAELGEERVLGLGEIPTNEYSRFAEPYLWVGADDNLDNPVPGTSKTTYPVANDYKPWLYNRTDQCPDKVYYRVVYGDDTYSGFDAYLILLQNRKSLI